MNDLEIERRIADIEGVHYIETKYDKNNFLALVSENGYVCSAPEMIGKYSPLTDDGLCKRLVVKHKVALSVAYKIWKARIKTADNAHVAHDKNYSKAAMLAIISAHKDV